MVLMAPYKQPQFSCLTLYTEFSLIFNIHIHILLIIFLSWCGIHFLTSDMREIFMVRAQ